MHGAWVVVLVSILCVAGAQTIQKPHYRDGEHNEDYEHFQNELINEYISGKNPLTVLDIAEYKWKGGKHLLSGHSLNVNESIAVETMSKTETSRVGFLLGFANSAILETSEGLMMLDSGSFVTSTEQMERIKKWSDRPLHTVVYSHGHYDHIFGIDEWEASNPNSQKVRIVGHKNIVNRFERYKLTRGYNTLINTRQFESEADPLYKLPVDFRFPDLVYDNMLDIDFGGEKVKLRHDKGETDDCTWMYIPSHEALCTGDLFIWHSPNCGNPQKVQRYPREWAIALRKMLELNAKILLPGHGLPIIGRDRVREALENTAKYLESLVNQTLKHMNDGKNLNEIIHLVKSPKELDDLDLPYLQHSYDEPEFVVRNLWRQYAGWWDGDPSNLKPAPTNELASEIASLVPGGAKKLADRAFQLALTENFRLACHLVEVAANSSPDDPYVLDIYSKIYEMRADSPATTSSMAKGIFTAASKRKVIKVGNQGSKSSSWFSSFLNWIGLGKAEVSTQARQLSIGDLDVEALRTASKAQTPSESLHLYEYFKPKSEKDMALLKELATSENDASWVFVDNEEAVQTFKKSIQYTNNHHKIEQIDVYKGIVELPFKPEQIAAFVMDNRYDAMWQPRSGITKPVELLGNGVSIIYSRFPGKMMISDRDCVILMSTAFDFQQGEFYTAMSDIELESIPPVEDAVRMGIPMGGFRLYPHPSKPDHSIFISICSVQMKGTVSTMTSNVVCHAKTKTPSNIALVLKN